ncbi:MAG: hypothetical protein K2J84_08405 [Bacteroidaceae bacterium]|nr:hypothetical protein [Bacteroidaceae bacterium]
MNTQVNNSQSNVSVYTYLSQVQLLYSQYWQKKTQLAKLDNDLKVSNEKFDIFPTSQNLCDTKNVWNQKYLLMEQISFIINGIVSNLTEATRIALSSMLTGFITNNRLSVVLNDNTIAAINSLLEQDSHKLYIKELYKQYCIIQNIPMQLSDIEIRAQMTGIIIPNFNQLKMIIRGY